MRDSFLLLQRPWGSSLGIMNWIDWPTFSAVIILGTGSILAFFGVGVLFDVLQAYREKRIRDLNRRTNR